MSVRTAPFRARRRVASGPAGAVQG